MHAIACIRQVPDYEAPAELFTVEGTPPRIVAAREVRAVMGLFDNHALEAALRLRPPPLDLLVEPAAVQLRHREIADDGRVDVLGEEP